MRHVLGYEDVSFEDSYLYLMSCYQHASMPAETQTALFYLLLHSQDLFKMAHQGQVMDEDVGDEGAEFLSPPKIFLESLAELEDEPVNSEQVGFH